MHNFNMSEPGTYEYAVEHNDDLSETTTKRLVRDSHGEWHELNQSIQILGAFDQLVGLRAYEEGEKFSPDFEKSREIVDEAVADSKLTGLPLDLCFQTIVQRRDHEMIVAMVCKETREK